MGAGKPQGLPALKFYTGGNVVLTMSLSANTLFTMPDSAKKAAVVFVYLFLVLSTAAVFWQVHNFDFVNYDDLDYVSQNHHVLSGITSNGLAWAFTTGLTANWHPLTWLALMLDCQLFGPNPGWIHLENVLLHIVNALLLFTVLMKMTGSLWPSAFVAAAFALHPMHVESVAWIAERKDVLSTLFFMLTLLTYIFYTKNRITLYYILSIILFALGLMAKPMLVSLPFVLLLLDYWPLNRFAPTKTVKTSVSQSCKAAPGRDKRQIVYRIIIEKIPFFVLSAVSSIFTFLVQQGVGAVVNVNIFPLQNRIANAFLSYARYIGKMFWPQNLAVFYPTIINIPFWQAAICVLLLLVITVFVLRCGGRRKYLPIGWFWFLGTLVPVIGLVQVGEQSMADRYTYIPYIGLFIMIAWGLPELVLKWPYRKIVLGLSMLIVLTALAVCARRQVSYWNNSITLFSHALEVTQNNYLAHSRLGEALRKKGNVALAIEHYTKSLQINPVSANAHNNLGVALAKQGKLAEAVAHFNQAVQLMPNFAEAHDNLANALMLEGRLDDSAAQFRQAIHLKPDWPEPMSNLAFLMATHPEIKSRDVNEAVRLASRACELTNYHDPVLVGTLAAAYASAGKFSEAVDTAKIAINLADAANKPQLKNVLQYHLSLYSQGKPYIESPRQTPNREGNQ